MRKHSVKKFLICFVPLVLLSALIGGVLDHFFIEDRWLAWTIGAIQGAAWGVLVVTLYYYWLEKS